MVSTGEETANNTVLVSMQIQLGEIKGILNTIVTEHARRIGDSENNLRQVRFDLDAVKTEAKKDVGDLATRLTNMATKASEDGNKILLDLNRDITTNKSNISELKGDMTEVKEKQNSSTNRVLAVLAGIVGVASLLWNMIGDKVQ